MDIKFIYSEYFEMIHDKKIHDGLQVEFEMIESLSFWILNDLVH